MSPNPGAAWKAIGTGDFFDNGLSDILWQNARWAGGGLGNERDQPDRRRHRWLRSRVELASNRDGRFQRRRSFRHSLAEHRWAGRDLGNERNQHSRRRAPLAPIPGRVGKRSERAISMTTAIPTSCGRIRDGQAAIWEMNGTNLIGGGAVAANPGPSWKAIGTGDFNNDGHSDILWQNSQWASCDLGHERDQCDRWRDRDRRSRAELARHRNGVQAAVIPTSCLKTRDGQVAIWEMNGTNIIGGGVVNPNPGIELEGRWARRLTARTRPFPHSAVGTRPFASSVCLERGVFAADA